MYTIYDLLDDEQRTLFIMELSKNTFLLTIYKKNFLILLCYACECGDGCLNRADLGFGFVYFTDILQQN